MVAKLEDKEQLERLSKELQEHKSWAEDVKNKQPVENNTLHHEIAQEVHKIMLEEKHRLRRANKFTLRGIPQPEKESPTQFHQSVKTTLQEKFDHPGLEVLSARRVDKANERGKSRLVIFSVEQGQKRSLLTTKL